MIKWKKGIFGLKQCLETMLKNKSVINVRPVSVASMIYLRVRWRISHIFHTCSPPVLSWRRYYNINMQLSSPYNEPDDLTCNPTSRNGTGYTYTWWFRPAVEPVWFQLNTFSGGFCKAGALVAKQLWRCIPYPNHRSQYQYTFEGWHYVAL